MIELFCTPEQAQNIRELSGSTEQEFSVAKLSDMLPARIYHEGQDYFLHIHKGNRGWYVEYKTNKLDAIINSDGELDRPYNYLFSTWRDDYKLVNAIAKYVILLLKSNLIKITT